MKLTKQELKVLILLTNGNYTRKSAAEKLNISTKTLDNHFQNVKIKLGIQSIVQLTHYSISLGIVKVKNFIGTLPSDYYSELTTTKQDE